MQQRNFARRRARRGKGLLPPNPRQWDVEHHALDLRDDLAIGIDVPLSIDDAFDLLPDVIVLPHGELPVAHEHLHHFRDGGRRAWSGMGIPLPTGGTMVVFNDSHPPARVRSTLMEEFFHLRLGHPATVIRLYAGDNRHRTHDPALEGEAYGSGAAALVPYKALRANLAAGESVRRIAQLFEVSVELVIFRAKVTKLYGLLRRRS